MAENVGDVIGLVIALVVIVVFLVRVAPDLAVIVVIKEWVIPAAVGLCAGKLAGGVYKEIAT